MNRSFSIHDAARRAIPLLAILLAQVQLCQCADLLVRTDLECRLTLDGKTLETLSPNQPVHLTLAAGQHRIEATPLGGGTSWQKNVTLSDGDAQQELTILLLGKPVYWVDADTKRMWTAADNGFGLSWNQALRYCRELSLAGFKDWALPSIDDLQRIFEKENGVGGYHSKGPLKLTGWQWSATPGAQEGEGWALDFGDGGRASVPAGDSGLNRALCVRHVEK